MTTEDWIFSGIFSIAASMIVCGYALIKFSKEQNQKCISCMQDQIRRLDELEKKMTDFLQTPHHSGSR